MSEQVKVLFFATLRDKAGVRETMLEISPDSHITDIKDLIVAKFPGLKQNMESAIIAVNHQFAFDEDSVPNGAEIAIFPPVSGGDLKNAPTVIGIVENAIDINQLVEKITSPTIGAACIFSGIVRGVTLRGSPHETDWLVYEAYREMAEAKMEQICQEIRSRWQKVDGIAMIQRIGQLNQGEISVIVACSSSHRDEGIFEAARYGIDRLKEIVPVWKKEVSKDGEVWIDGSYIPKKGE